MKGGKSVQETQHTLRKSTFILGFSSAATPGNGKMGGKGKWTVIKHDKESEMIIWARILDLGRERYNMQMGY